MFSCVQLFANPWTVALQAPLSVEFSKQEYWSGLPFPISRDLPDAGIKPAYPASLAGEFFAIAPPRKPHMAIMSIQKVHNVVNRFFYHESCSHMENKQYLHTKIKEKQLNTETVTYGPQSLESCPTLSDPRQFSRQAYYSGLLCPPPGDLTLTVTVK